MVRSMKYFDENETLKDIEVAIRKAISTGLAQN